MVEESPRPSPGSQPKAKPEEVPNQKRRNSLCWSSSNQGQSQARSRENKSCASHDQTIQHERVKNISWVYPISRKVFTQYGRSQCTTSKVAGKGHSIAMGKATR